MGSSNKLLNASFWVFFTFGASQIIRFGSSIITTRLVSPDLMGVMAVVMLVIVGVEMFCDTGFWAYVVRHKTPEDPTMLNTVWTLQVIRGWVVFALVLLISYLLYFIQIHYPHYLGGVYSVDNLPFLIAFAGTTALFNGFKSLASPIFASKMDRKKLELFELLVHFIVAAVTIISLSINPSIWILVSSTVLGTILHLFISFRFFPIRHRLMLEIDVVKDVFIFSRWIVLASAMTYLFLQGDRLFLAYKLTSTELGLYSIALTLIGVLMSVSQSFSVKILFPHFSNIVNENPNQLKKYFNEYKTRITLFALIISFILYMFSVVIFGTIYDERYSEASWMFKILLVSFVGTAVSDVSMECLSALSQTKVRSTIMFAKVLVLFISLPLAHAYFGFYGAVWAISLNVWVGIPFVYYGLIKNHIYSFQSDMLLIIALVLFLSMWLVLQI